MIYFDLETDGLLPQLTKIHCMSLYDDAWGDVAPVLYVGDEIDSAVKLLHDQPVSAHNAVGFDLQVLNRFYPDIRPSYVFDTLLISRVQFPHERHHSLMEWGKRLGVAKDDYTGGWEEYNPDMGSYCVQDCVVQIALTKHLMETLDDKADEWIDLETEVAKIIDEMCREGHRFDVEGAYKLLDQLLAEEKEVEEEIRRTAPSKWLPTSVFVPKRDNKRMGYVEDAKVTKLEYTEFNPGSDKHIAKWLMDEGWQPYNYTKSGQPMTNSDVLDELDFPLAKLITKWKGFDKKRSQLEGWIKAERDGYIHGTIITNGAYTGRMTHRNPNMANVDSDPRLRALWLPDEGDVMVGIDAEGLELRLLAHYLAPLDGGEYGRAVVDGKQEDGTDAHTKLQNILGLKRRNSAKTFIYALVYGAGNAKLGATVCKDQGRAIGPHAMMKVGSVARNKATSGIKGLNHLTTVVKDCHSKQGWVRGLDGRILYTKSAHAALNTLIQAAGAVIMKRALVIFYFEKLRKSGLRARFINNIHDEWQLSVHPDDADEVAKLGCQSIVEAGEYYNLNVPMAGSYSIGNNWSETH